jgi:O-antigen/teichoic acid export membrane protein
MANIFRSGISFATGVLLARWLGPEGFGRMAFLLATFMAFRQLLDMASSYAFFTFLSKRQRSKQFINFFWLWVFLQFLFSLLVVGLLLPDSVLDSVWKGENRIVILLALVAVFMQQNVWTIASQMAEAQRETIRVQRLNVLVVIIHLFVILALWFIGKLLLPLIFVALIIEWSIASWFAQRMYQGDREKVDFNDGESETVKSVLKEFWNYCKPFIPYVWLSFAHDIGDRWMLQHWGGSSEQAYYAVAQQFSAIALLATASILRIFWKEIAEAQHKGDKEKVKALYQKVSKGLYFVGAIAAGGLMPWAAEIINLLFGSAYLDGTYTLMLMLLYPVHQSMGQIGGAMLLATENTRIQVIIGCIFLVVSIIMVYFMLAPKNLVIPGLNLNSQGLAIKMIVMQLIQVNVLAWFIAKIFGWKFEWIYQVAILGMTIGVGWFAKIVVISVISSNTIVLMISFIPLYLIIILSILSLVPSSSMFNSRELLKHI